MYACVLLARESIAGAVRFSVCAGQIADDPDDD